MKTIDYIPTSKIARASKLLTTGIKVGGNYTKYYSKKLFVETDKSELDQDNATTIYDGLKDMKGSALKVIQMLSMEKNLLPQSYYETFSLAQFSVPSLSYPLVRKAFLTHLNKLPQDLFDSFEKEARAAATIGQVHYATKDNKAYAVKIQYPGVAESISSDLKLVKPFALKMFNIKANETEPYFKEVESKLLEETNYTLELKQSLEIVNSCKELPNLKFPNYYPELSSDKILTMDWIQGIHLSEFSKDSNSNKDRQQIGQALWDFYMFQIYNLKKVHADPHPGNFLVTESNQLVPIDFGCMKEIPKDFYRPYFSLATNEVLNDPIEFEKHLYELEILKSTDSKESVEFVKGLFHKLLSIFTKPFLEVTFDFSNPAFWNEIASITEVLSQDKTIRKMDGNRGSKHFLYVNRTFFGLYNLLYDLGVVVDTHSWKQHKLNK
jgi:predicted unusual protein kinase regulating ubiquinone biosynthesis (AarF/ABC1/UbiB family)